ncbi:mitochondrial protein [Tremella mesenterica]|uniref:Mitochondrial protein n=1 Tax=Tremella mesenterica TaxID=5217 RepID=A0A4Q1BU34_TREME|nr:uncharacterized protein TREMEDRAFT_33306 [Tremella mesenterica DSM 1558]EIW67545.1 hypothetical protein TREMEDRAFT_33306 [Tremella mesenterica DSM 1558]RXK41528.1 mitochondrial protein [Tremella mesenterica]
MPIPSSLTLPQTLVLTAFASAIATTSVILSYQALKREHYTEKLKKQVGEDVEVWEQSRAGSGVTSPEERAESRARGEKGKKKWEEGEFDEGLIREQLTRNYNFLGEESMALVRKSYVVVVGCGGVGSWCALMLLRSGIGRLLLIDFDMTTLSSLNRHASATLEDVGTPKVIAMQKHLQSIAPWARIEVKVGLWKKGQGESWLEGADWVVDAIDNIDTKVDLLTHCYKTGIKVFSSMGAGAKRDPTRVQIADISNTYEDPLARSVRRRLRLNGVPSGIPVVYSTEIPSTKLLPLPESEFQQGNITHLQPFDDFRIRILPVLGPLPAIFGLNISLYILLSLSNKPLIDQLEIKNRSKLYKSLERGLMEREQKIKKSLTQDKNSITHEDVGFVFEEIYHGRSTIPPRIILPKTFCIRWDGKEDVKEDNIVFMGLKDVEIHEKECLREGRSLEDVWGKEVVDYVEGKREEIRRVLNCRRG